MIDLQKDHILEDAELRLSVETEDGSACREVHWRIENPGDSNYRGAIRLHVDLPEHFTSPWFMIPGFFYGENRRIGQRATKFYPRFDETLEEPEDMTSSWWDVSADRTAAPLVYVHQGQNCFCAASEPHYVSDGVSSEDEEPQVSVGFGHDGTEGYIRFTVPACEEPFAYTCRPEQPPAIRRIALPPGASISGKLYFYEMTGDRHQYQSVIEHYYSHVGGKHEPASLPEIESLVEDAAHGIVEGHYHRDANYFIYSRPYDPVIEQIGNARGITMEWHEMLTGFVNGFPVCNGLLKASALTGDEEARDVACRVADRICREGVSPSGLFWAAFVPGQVVTPNGNFTNPISRTGQDAWGSGWLPQETWVHSRTISDACRNLAEMIAWETERLPNSPSLALWQSALERNLRTALDLQQGDGSYGQYYDAVERKITKSEGCGGLLWIPAMVKACRLGLGGQRLVDQMSESVRRAGNAYASYVEEENIWGAPEDNESPTSEDGQNAVMAYTDLYEFTGEERYLALARQAADWMLTFRKTYNQIVSSRSLMGIYGMRSKGGDYASVSNNHLHVFEVLCTRHLCKLSEWTGNDYYWQRARDHWAFVCQYLSRADGMYNGFRGAAAEQFYWCDYGSWPNWQAPSCHRQKGNMAPFTAIWCIAVILLAAPDAERAFTGG